MGHLIKHERPNYVLNYNRPPHTEIKYIKGHWYLYETKVTIDSISGKKKKVTRLLGSITEDGFKKSHIRERESTIESQIKSDNIIKKEDESGEENINMSDNINFYSTNNTEPISSYKSKNICDDNKYNNCSEYRLDKNTSITQDVYSSAEVGATLYFYNRTLVLRNRLIKFFPDIWKEIYVLHILRLIYEPNFKRLKIHYLYSIISFIFPHLDLSSSGINKLIIEIGKRRSSIREFMREDIDKNDLYLLIDGHRLITASKSRILSELGYDSKMRFKPQINLLYIFSLEFHSSMPAYYKQYCGSTPDVTAFNDLLKDCGLEENNVIAVTDKGFASEDDFSLLEECHLQYIIPLKRNNVNIKNQVPVSFCQYDNAFVYNGRTIFFIEIKSESSFRVILYCDIFLYADEASTIVKRMEEDNNNTILKINNEEENRLKNKGKLTDEELSKLVPISLSEAFKDKDKLGTITLKTNCTNLNGEQIYIIWKTRQSIEKYFNIYDNTLGFSSSYMQNDISEEGRMFLNHLSGMTAMSCINDIYDHNLTKKISLNDIKELLVKITADFIEDKWVVKPIKKEILEMCRKLSFDPTDLSVLEEIVKKRISNKNF